MPILNENTYKTALEEAGICLKRASLYEPQLEWARDALDGFAGAVPAAYAGMLSVHWGWRILLKDHRNARGLDLNYNVFTRAFSGDNLVKLVVELAKQLDVLAACLIYYNREDENDKNRKHQPYNNNVVDAASYDHLVDAVSANNPQVHFAAYPFGAAAALPVPAVIPNARHRNFHLAAGHFVNNLRKCCNRIFLRWADLNEGLCPYIDWMGQEDNGDENWPIFEQVERLIPTGSDYHKGGQQVVLVDMALVPGRVGPSNRTNKKHGYGRRCRLARSLNQNANTLSRNEYGIERIVYKPADVEFDCRIVGDSGVINRISPGGYTQLDHTGAAGARSLSEQINQILNLPLEKQLPTYVILPYHPASTLAPNWGAAAGGQVVDIRQSYGFMQFLTHRPGVKGRPSISRLAQHLRDHKRPSWLEESDYISSEPNHPVDFYFIWGQLMAMAATFCLSDLHRQNTIVHRSPYDTDSNSYPPIPSWPKPHLIDVEDGFKWPMYKLENTGITGGNLLRAVECEAKLLVVRDKTTNLSLDWDRKLDDRELTLNQAFVFDQGTGRLKHSKPNRLTKRAMCEGFLTAMEAFRDAANNPTLQTWVDGLANTFTRFVPIPTGEFYKQMIAYLAGYTYLRYRSKELNVMESRADWNQVEAKALPDAEQKWKAHVTCALAHDDHNFHDFDNLDIPYYVHNLNHPDLLNSRGQKVNIGQSLADQDNQGGWHLPVLGVRTGRPGGGPNALADYFPESAVTFVKRQLDDLLSANDDFFFERMTAMLEEILNLHGIMEGPEEGGLSKFSIPGDSADQYTSFQEGIVLSGNIQYPNAPQQTIRANGYTYDFYDGVKRAEKWVVRDNNGHQVWASPRRDFKMDEFMGLVRAANPDFTQRRSSLNNLINLIKPLPATATIQQVDAEVKTIPTNKREKYGDAIQYLWDRYQQGGVRLDTLQKWLESDYREFMRRVRVANPGFTQKRSSLNNLIRAINARDPAANIQTVRNQIPQPKRNTYHTALAHLTATYPGYNGGNDL